jgi:hypothetical protein
MARESPKYSCATRPECYLCYSARPDPNPNIICATRPEDQARPSADLLTRHTWPEVILRGYSTCMTGCHCSYGVLNMNVHPAPYRIRQCVCVLQAEGENVSKLEKADILELTVQHLHRLRRPRDAAEDAHRFQVSVSSHRFVAVCSVSGNGCVQSSVAGTSRKQTSSKTETTLFSCVLSVYVGYISGSHGDAYEDGCLLGWCAV